MSDISFEKDWRDRGKKAITELEKEDKAWQLFWEGWQEGCKLRPEAVDRAVAYNIFKRMYNALSK